MKYKAYLCSFLLTFPILGKASAEADSLRQVQISRLQEPSQLGKPGSYTRLSGRYKIILGRQSSGALSKAGRTGNVTSPGKPAFI